VPKKNITKHTTQHHMSRLSFFRYARIDHVIVLLIGIAIGASLNAMNNAVDKGMNSGPSKGTIKSLEETPVRNTVHVDEQGRPITKQQLLEPFVIPNLVGFSVATFLPGQVMMVSCFTLDLCFARSATSFIQSQI
jgi:hypothetical protein